ncbi:MAG: lyase family protein [Bacteroidales bacterium]
MLLEVTLPGLQKLRDTLAAKSRSLSWLPKLGVHLMDATPLTLGQEFSGYVSQLDHGMRALKNTLPHLAELALGGTAVGTGINTPKGYAVKVAEYCSTYRAAFVTAEKNSKPFRVTITSLKLRERCNDYYQPDAHFKQHPPAGFGPRCGIGEVTPA